MVSKALFSSAKQDWPTPDDLFAWASDRWGPFDLDVCATAENTKCEQFITPELDGLAQPWFGKCWMNPPYGRSAGDWVYKAFAEICRIPIREGHKLYWPATADRVVCLLPARTDVRWFHDNARFAAEIVFLKGRVKFKGASGPAPFPSMIIVFE